MLDRSFRDSQLDELSAEVLSIARQNRVDAVWSVLSHGITIHLTKRILDQSVLPVVSTVLDPPEYFGVNCRLDRGSTEVMMEAFGFVLRKSTAVSVISESMKDQYQALYNIDAIVWRHGIERGIARQRRVNDSDTIIIGFAGSMYAKREWNALLNAIESAKGQVGGKRVIVRFIGRFPRRIARKASCLELLGTRSFEDTLCELSKVDIGYLPYWFDKKYASVVTKSFPSKLSAYVAANIPVLYHGPRESSVCRFFEDYPVGVNCNSLAASDILHAVQCLALDNTTRDVVFRAQGEALERELGKVAMQQRFARLVEAGKVQ